MGKHGGKNDDGKTTKQGSDGQQPIKHGGKGGGGKSGTDGK